MNRLVRCLSSVAVVLSLGLALPVRADDTSDAARVDKLLKQSGYAFTKKGDTVWVIQQHGDNLGISARSLRSATACW